MAVQNIRSLIPVVLDVSGNYARWKDQFLLVVGKFSLCDHVLSDAPLLLPNLTGHAWTAS